MTAFVRDKSLPFVPDKRLTCNKNVDLSKSKAFADDKINTIKNVNIVLGWVDNIPREGLKNTG